MMFVFFFLFKLENSRLVPPRARTAKYPWSKTRIFFSFPRPPPRASGAGLRSRWREAFHSARCGLHVTLLSFICSAAYTGSPPHLDRTLQPEGESRSSLARAWAPRPATSQGWAAGGGLIRGGRPDASEGSRGVTCQHHAHLDPGGTWGWLHGCSDGQSFQIREHTCVRAHVHMGMRTLMCTRVHNTQAHTL